MFASFLLWQQVSQRVLHLRRSGFLLFPSDISVAYLLNPVQIPTQDWNLSPDEELILISIPQRPWWPLTVTSIQYWTYLRASTDPSFCFGYVVISRQCVFTTWTRTIQFCQFRFVYGRKILSSNDSLQHADYSKIIWKICDSLCVFSQQVSPRPQDSQKSEKPILHTYPLLLRKYSTYWGK